jgi:hypothetical protein
VRLRHQSRIDIVKLRSFVSSVRDHQSQSRSRLAHRSSRPLDPRFTIDRVKRVLLLRRLINLIVSHGPPSLPKRNMHETCYLPWIPSRSRSKDVFVSQKGGAGYVNVQSLSMSSRARDTHPCCRCQDPFSHKSSYLHTLVYQSRITITSTPTRQKHIRLCALSSNHYELYYDLYRSHLESLARALQTWKPIDTRRLWHCGSGLS